MSAANYQQSGGPPKWTRAGIAKTRKWLEKLRKERAEREGQTKASPKR